MTRSRIIYWNTVPTPYMVDRFNAVADRNKFDFEVWFSDRKWSEHDWRLDEDNWRFRYRFLPGVRIWGKRLTIPLPLLTRERPDLLVAFYSSGSMLLGIALARARGARVALWSQVTPEGWSKRREWKECIKRYVFKRVDATFGSGEESREFAMSYGAPPNRALILRHAIDVEHFRKGREKWLKYRDQIRAELGVCGVVFIYVGRLWWGKGLNYLLDAFDNLQKSENQDTSLLIVGDGPERKGIENFVQNKALRNVILTGYVQIENLPRLYTAADVFVFPTLGDPYGLVVDESMVSSLPVLSADCAGEIRDRVKHGVNGFLFPAKDSDALANKMKWCVNHADQLPIMGKESQNIIGSQTPTKWAIDFECHVISILN